MTMHYAWTCEVCEKPIADGAGYLAMSYTASPRVRRPSRKRVRANSSALDELDSVAVREPLLAGPASKPSCALGGDPRS
jgi:hypothetical protein